MKTLKNRKLLEIGLALCVLGGVAGGSFFAARHLLRGGAQAQPPPEEGISERLQEFIRATEAERNKPRFSGIINGIRIIPTNDDAADDPKTNCWVAKAEGRWNIENLPYDAAIGTPFEISPAYLPSGAVEDRNLYPGPVVTCNGTLDASWRVWNFESGGYIGILKYGGEHAAMVDASQDRLSAATIRGKPAVVVYPLTPDGSGPGKVIVAEDFGVTIVYGDNFPADVYIAVAEGLK